MSIFINFITSILLNLVVLHIPDEFYTWKAHASKTEKKFVYNLYRTEIEYINLIYKEFAEILAQSMKDQNCILQYRYSLVTKTKQLILINHFTNLFKICCHSWPFYRWLINSTSYHWHYKPHSDPGSHFILITSDEIQVGSHTNKLPSFWHRRYLYQCLIQLKTNFQYNENNIITFTH